MLAKLTRESMSRLFQRNYSTKHKRYWLKNTIVNHKSTNLILLALSNARIAIHSLRLKATKNITKRPTEKQPMFTIVVSRKRGFALSLMLQKIALNRN